VKYRYFVPILFAALFAQRLFKKNLPEKIVVSFPSDKLSLGGVLFKPSGKGPFPTLLYNHGSAPGMLNDRVSDLLGPYFAERGWVFFMPYRRGQGLSENAGRYVMDEVEAERKKGGLHGAAHCLTKLLKTEQLSDQLAALAWIQKQTYIKASRVAVFGNSFGGIETVLGAERGNYCAAIDASGGAMSWDSAPELRAAMIEAVQKSRVPIFFYQAENDFNLSPSKVLSEAMRTAGKPYEVKFYPPYGKTPAEGHSFAYMGASTWASDVFIFLSKYCGG